MNFFKIYLVGDTYGQFDGEVLIATTEKNPLLVNEYTLNYSGMFYSETVLKVIQPFLSTTEQGIAFIRAGARKPFISNKELFDKDMDECILQLVKNDKLKNGILKVYPKEIPLLVNKSKKGWITATSTVEDLNWNTDNGGTVCDIRNAITIFEGRHDYLVFTMGGMSIRKKLRADDKKKLLG